MHFIYKLTSPSGKSYIGKTSRSLIIRFREHISAWKTKKFKSKLYNAFDKYNPSLWSKEIIFETTDKNIIYDKEDEYIKKYDTIKNGYNILLGGTKGSTGMKFKFTEEHKRKISIALKGKKKTKEHVLKINRKNSKWSKSQYKKFINSVSRYWKIITPSKQELIIHNLAQYCRDNNLTSSNMILVSQGKLKHYKGYIVFRQ